MPRDTYVIESFETTEPDALTRIGIAPVPQSFVEKYKNDYRAAWLAEHARYLPPSQFVWDRIYHIKGTSLAKFLSSALRCEYAADVGPAPMPLVRLAMRVERELPGAKFSVQYFNEDPILDVHYKNGSKVACLGIWNPEVQQRGGLIAIAEHDAPKDWWDRLVAFWRD